MSQYHLRKIRDSGCSWNGLGNQTPILTIKDITGKTWSQVSKQGQCISIKYISIQAVQPYASWRPFQLTPEPVLLSAPTKGCVYFHYYLSFYLSHTLSIAFSLLLSRLGLRWVERYSEKTLRKRKGPRFFHREMVGYRNR